MQNVIQKFQGMTPAKVMKIIAKQRGNHILILQNIIKSGNIGTMIRTANAFLPFKEIIIFGDRKYNKRATVGTENYEHVRHISDKNELLQYIRDNGYDLVSLEYIDGVSRDIRGIRWPSKTALMIGDESSGIYKTFIQASKDVVHIPQFGSVRSLNAGVAAGIAMFDIISKEKKCLTN